MKGDCQWALLLDASHKKTVGVSILGHRVSERQDTQEYFWVGILFAYAVKEGETGLRSLVRACLSPCLAGHLFCMLTLSGNITKMLSWFFLCFVSSLSIIILMIKSLKNNLFNAGPGIMQVFYKQIISNSLNNTVNLAMLLPFCRCWV